MNAEQQREHEPPTPQVKRDDERVESLTDFIDRVDRDAFRRALKHRDLRIIDIELRPEPR